MSAVYSWQASVQVGYGCVTAEMMAARCRAVDSGALCRAKATGAMRMREPFPRKVCMG